ncbi:MAG: SH3 domain-containing protein [Acidaminococcaceae bacterium]
MRSILVILMLIFLFNGNIVLAAGLKSELSVDKTLLRPAVWLDNKNGNVAIMDQQEISALNKRMQAENMPDLQNYPAYISGEKVKSYIQEYEFDTDLYVNGKLLTSGQIAALAADRNLDGVAEETNIKYGVVVQRTNLRSLPTDLKAFSTPSDKEFDMWQETAVDPAEPVLVLHYNEKRNFVYVQMRNYRGWLPAKGVALTDYDVWLKYVCPEKFAIVTGKLLLLKADKAQLAFQMGSRIPSEGKNLLLPVREANGNLKIVKAAANYGDTLHAGYLPYTTNNLIKQAFKFLDSPYGWGGLHDSVDCSSFVADVYRTMGVELPRNADEQEEANTGSAIDLSVLEGNEKLKAVNSLPPGSALFMPNHVMLYLGSKKGRPYIIHALGSYGSKSASGEYVRVPVMKVVVSDVFLTSQNGKSFLAKFTAAQSFR